MTSKAEDGPTSPSKSTYIARRSTASIAGTEGAGEHLIEDS